MKGSERRLAAVWFADLVGFSELSATDERSAVELLEVLHTTAKTTIEGSAGRLVKFIGDEAFAEYRSADAAVRAALRLRRDFEARCADLGTRAQLRIGIHLGEVVVGADGDLFGDGVNIASRITAAAEPGQVLVTQDVWRQLRQQRELTFLPVGERGFKGIPTPVQAFEATDDESFVTPPVHGSHPPRRAWQVSRTTRVVLAFLLLIGLAQMVRVLQGMSGVPLPLAPGEAFAAPDPAIAVFPFEAPDGDSMWARGIPRLLSLAMDGVAGVRVIDPGVTEAVAAGAAVTGSQRAVEFGRGLEARYAALGSVTSTGGSGGLHVSMRIFDVVTGRELNAVSANGGVDSLARLVEALASRVLGGRVLSGARPESVDLSSAATASLPALRAYLSGGNALKRSDWETARRHFEEAVGHDSTFALALYHRALARSWTTLPHRLEIDRDAERAESLAGGLPERGRLRIQGYAQLNRRSRDAIATLRRLTTTYPDDPEGWFLLGDALYHLEGPDSGFREALGRAVDLIEGFGLAYPHLIEDAVIRGDTAFAGSLLARYRLAHPDSPMLPGLEWASLLARAEPAEPAVGVESPDALLGDFAVETERAGDLEAGIRGSSEAAERFERIATDGSAPAPYEDLARELEEAAGARPLAEQLGPEVAAGGPAEAPLASARPETAGTSSNPVAREAPTAGEVARSVLARLSEAIESEDLEAVRRVWPSITPAQARSFQALFESVDDLGVTFDVTDASQQDRSIVVQVRTSYDFFSRANRQREHQETGQVFELRGTDGAWTIAGSRP